MKSKEKVKDYQNIESIICMPMDDRSNECWLMHTPEELGITIAKNVDPIRVNTVKLEGSGDASCSLFNRAIQCAYDETADCRHHISQSLLHCGEYVLE